MEGRLKKLIQYLHDCTNIQLVHISAFQLGQLAKESPDLVLLHVCPLILHKNIEVSKNASLSLSEILKKHPLTCGDTKAAWRLSDLLEERLSSKKAHKSPEGILRYLDTWREILVLGDWEEKLKASYGLLPFARHNILCPSCTQDLASRSLYTLSHDQVADYSGDIAVYPLRELTSQIIKQCLPRLSGASLQAIVKKYLREVQAQGPLLVIRKCKLFQADLYEDVKACLDKQEDVITQACHALLGFRPVPDQDLCDKIAQILTDFDDLSPCLKYAIKLFDRMLNLGCTPPADMHRLFPLFFHKLTEVRVALYHSATRFLGVSAQRLEFFHLIVQGLLFEQNTNILKSCKAIVGRLRQDAGIAGYFSEVWPGLCAFIREVEPVDFSVVKVYGDPEDPRSAYSFANYGFSDDAQTNLNVELKFFRRLWNIAECAKIVGAGLALDRRGYALLLCTLSGLVDNQLEDLLEFSSNSGVVQTRIRVAACMRLLEQMRRSKVIPERLTPVIQTVVTAYNNETCELFRRKISKCASGLTEMFAARNCNERFVANMVKRWPNPFLKDLQCVHKEATFTAFQLLRTLIQNPQQNPGLFQQLTTHIHSSLKEQYLAIFQRLVQHNTPEIVPSLLNIITQVSDVVPFFILTVIQTLSCPVFSQSLLDLLLLSLKSAPVNILPFCACLITPILNRLYSSNTQNTKLAQLFGEILPMLMISPEHVVPSELIPYKDSGLEFLGYLRSSYSLPKYVPSAPLPIQLREYQQEGVAWLMFLRRYGLGGMLCDEMGLGKTLQALCAISEAHNERPQSESLVVCPNMVIGHWMGQIRKYFPRLTTKDQLFPRQEGGGVLVLSYNAIKSKLEQLASRRFCYIVLDEGHLIRNTSTQIFKNIKRLSCEHRIILTGTPIQNKVLELWPFFDFLMPGFLSSEKSFIQIYKKDLTPKRTNKDSINFANEQRSLQKLNSLHKKVLPFILRRLKKDVSDIPEKIIQDYYVSLSPEQHRLLSSFQNGHPNSIEQITFLRRLGYHPHLIDPSIPYSLKVSPKLRALKELLINCQIAEEAGCGHKALVFYQMKEACQIIESMLKQEFPATKYLKFQGFRQGAIEAFNSDSSVRLMLLSTKVGGLGVNLQAADVVIFIDHDWNPVVDLQAMDRAHRIGQRNVVNVYRLITRGTLEEQVLGLQAFKTKLSEILVNSENASMQSIDTTDILANFNSI